MGNPTSKFEQELPENVIEEAVASPTTPIATPESPKMGRICELLDPRSPSADIVRTPIQFLKETLAEDPRSPTTDFERTPIVVAQKPPSKLHNKNLDNARKQLVALTPSGKVLQQKHAPKLLESSPMKPKSDTTNKRKSLIGVLETNLDFKETDLDEVIQNIDF